MFRSIRRSMMRLPLAPANWPVAPVIVLISTIRLTSGGNAGVACPANATLCRAQAL